MTGDRSAIVCRASRGNGCRTVRVPPTELSAADKKAITEAQAAIAEWEASRHANEAAYWGAHLDELASRLASMRRRRGDERCARLVRDAIAAVKATYGPDAAVLARDRLSDVWRGPRPRMRP